MQNHSSSSIHKLILSIGLLFCWNTILWSASPSAITIGSRNITPEYFQYVFHKNRITPNGRKQSAEEYLRDFTNFELKVSAARQAKEDTTQAFRDFCEQKRAELSRKYLNDSSELATMVETELQRSAEDIDLSHILIREDSLNKELSKQRALTARRRIDVDPFDTVARWMSDDPSVVRNQGHLGWMTAMWVVWPLEEAVYNAKVGEIGGPLQSRYGWHIYKVNARRRNMGARLVTRIDSTGQEEEMPWLRIGETAKEVEDAVFALRNIGEITPPVRTIMGTFQFRLMEKKSWEEMKDNLRDEIRTRIVSGQMDRSLVVRERLANRLRAENGWTDKKWSDDEVIAKEDAQLEQKFPAMKHELEYQKDLWLFFRAQEREWNTIAMDEEGMRRQFENNKAKYIQQELSQGRKQPVTYRDVRGLVEDDLQKERDIQWLDQLRQAHPVKVNTAIIQTIQ